MHAEDSFSCGEQVTKKVEARGKMWLPWIQEEEEAEAEVKSRHVSKKVVPTTHLRTTAPFNALYVPRMTAVAIQYRDEIIQRVAQGEYLASIANDLGLKGKGQSISDYLANDPEYQHAREFGLAAKMQKRETELECAPKDDVPRARELLSHARWRAEREAPHIWGQKSQVTNLNIDAGDWSDRLRRARERVISPDSHKDSHTAIEHSAQHIESTKDSA